MTRKKVVNKLGDFIRRYRVTHGKNFSLDDFDPDDTHGLGSEAKDEAKEQLVTGINWLAELQDKLYAQNCWAVLIIMQAMDAAGKDGTIKHVMSGINPQGCQVYSFKQPSVEELDHDFMWRYARCVPERGRIGIFNRSYYEEVLVVRVHKEILKAQCLPRDLVTKNIWEQRLEDIHNYEQYLARNGVIVLKFFLHISKAEQKKRFMERLTRADKNWKFNSSDVRDREYWDDYMSAYEAAISATATKDSPWFIVPANHKWFSRLVVAAAIVEKLERLNLHYPVVDKEQKKELEAARKLLEKARD